MLILGMADSGIAQDRVKNFGGQAKYTPSSSNRAVSPRFRICWREFDLGRTTIREIQSPRADAEFVAEVTDRLNGSASNTSVTIWMETLDVGVLPILAAIDNLESLKIVGSTVRAGSLGKLRLCSTLKYLSLDGCVLGDATCAELSQISSLEYVQLTGAAVTDRGLKHLGGIKKLRELDLRGTRISDEGLKSLQQSHALRLLDVRGTIVTAVGAQRLLRTLKDLRIHFQPTNRPVLRLVTR